jgi:hypothetical protein
MTTEQTIVLWVLVAAWGSAVFSGIAVIILGFQINRGLFSAALALRGQSALLSAQADRIRQLEGELKGLEQLL